MADYILVQSITTITCTNRTLQLAFDWFNEYFVANIWHGHLQNRTHFLDWPEGCKKLVRISCLKLFLTFFFFATNAFVCLWKIFCLMPNVLMVSYISKIPFTKSAAAESHEHNGESRSGKKCILRSTNHSCPSFFPSKSFHQKLSCRNSTKLFFFYPFPTSRWECNGNFFSEHLAVFVENEIVFHFILIKKYTIQIKTKLNH